MISKTEMIYVETDIGVLQFVRTIFTNLILGATSIFLYKKIVINAIFIIFSQYFRNKF